MSEPEVTETALSAGSSRPTSGTLLLTVQEQVLARLGRIGVAARQAVESALVGQHRSVRRGLSVEFAGHRPYQPGDDLRHLDWSVYARSDRFDVRVFEEETRLRATIVVDASGSMDFGSGELPTKLDYARQLAAALAFLMVRQADAVGLAVIDDQVRSHLPPASTTSHLAQMLDRLEHIAAGGETALGSVLEHLAIGLKRRGLVVLITDGFDDPERLLMGLRLLIHRRQDIRLFQITDPAEETLPLSGIIAFHGLEHEPRQMLDADRIRKHYLGAMKEHRQRLAAGCHALGIAFETMTTNEDLALALGRALARDGYSR
jgi:uncharacterized protein (DUF58 family)